jgi:hypothetical protein
MGVPVKTPPPFNWHSDLCKFSFSQGKQSLLSQVEKAN